MLNYLFTLVFSSLSSLNSLLASRHLSSLVICRAFHDDEVCITYFCTHSSTDCNFSSAVESEVLGFASFSPTAKAKIKWWYFWAQTCHTTRLINIFDVWRRFSLALELIKLRAHVIFTRSLFTRSHSSNSPQVREYKLLFWNSPNWSVFNFHEMIYVLTLWAVAEGGWHQMMSKADDDYALGD